MTESKALEQSLAENADLMAQNARLRRLLAQADAPAELRHRLRNTLSVLRSIIHRSAKSRPDVEDYVAHLEDRIEAIARAQSAADMHGGINLNVMIAEEFLSYGVSEAERLTLAGPELMVSARTGQVLALAVHELTINSVEHGAIGHDDGLIEVRWKIEADRLMLDWRETSLHITGSKARTGFGTEFITEALPYQLGAVCNLSIEPGTVHCTIDLPLDTPAVNS